ncbi:MAG: ABC transporter substrate-binding protein [Ilumatobacteraceae bacterium]
MTSAVTDGSASTPGKATGAPIKVGIFNANTATNPQIEPGVVGGLDYVNNVLGGINGHPIELSRCDSDGTPEKAITCATNFVNDKVVAVLDAFDTSSGAALPILKSANIPLIGDVAQNPQVDASQDAFVFGPANAVYSVGTIQSFRDQGKKNVALALGDSPGAHTYVDSFLTPMAKAANITFTGVYYPPTSPNFSVIASTIMASNPDAGGAIAITDESQCTTLIKALRSAGFKDTILAAACTQFIATLGGDAAGVQVYSNHWLPQSAASAPDSVKAELTAMTTALTKAGSVDKQGFYTYGTFALFVNFQRAMSTVQGTLDGPTVTKTMLGLKDFQTFIGPKVTCDHTAWAQTSACSNQLMYLEVQPDGALEPVGGGFFTASTELLPSS